MKNKSTQSDTNIARRDDTEMRPSHHWDFIKEQAAKVPTKEGARKTEQSVVAFKNLKSGRNKPSYDALLAWCRNDKAFAAAFAMHIGVILPGDVERVEALMRMAMAFGRRE